MGTGPAAICFLVNLTVGVSFFLVVVGWGGVGWEGGEGGWGWGLVEGGWGGRGRVGSSVRSWSYIILCLYITNLSLINVF